MVYAAHPFLSSLKASSSGSRAMTTVFKKTGVIRNSALLDVVDDFEHSAVGHDETSHMAIPQGAQFPWWRNKKHFHVSP
jgi:hypothetical protein